MTEPTSAQDLFKGRHFDQEIIILSVRWYLTFKLSSRDLVQMMAERGIALTHTTILRWVLRYVPDFEKRWNRYARTVGESWRVDETYIKVRAQWVYLYRAVDKQGRTVDFLLSKRRDMAVAKRFFSRAVRQHGSLRVITLDGYAASHRAERTWPQQTFGQGGGHLQPAGCVLLPLQSGYRLVTQHMVIPPVSDILTCAGI